MDGQRRSHFARTNSSPEIRSRGREWALSRFGETETDRIRNQSSDHWRRIDQGEGRRAHRVRDRWEVSDCAPHEFGDRRAKPSPLSRQKNAEFQRGGTRKKTLFMLAGCDVVRATVARLRIHVY